MLPIQLPQTINRNLIEERKKATFNIEEFTEWWCGGPEKLRLKKEIERFFFDDRSLRDPIPTAYLSHQELHVESLRKNALVKEKLDQFISNYWGNKIDNRTKLMKQMEVSILLNGSEVFQDGHPFRIHYGVFFVGLLNLATKEQLDKLIEKVVNFEIIGTYAQTELGHGTFVRGIQTTATYDPKTDEIVINTPSLEAYKWWPGGMGQNCNYAMIVAQLYVKGQCYGIHQFIVQIRNTETWMPMAGITVGEIGPKLDSRTLNNGFLRLNNVRIPRTNMLMKFSTLKKDGTYIRSKSNVLAYTVMSYFRGQILDDTANQLSKATTIAVRYSAVRQQSPIEINQPEPQIIDHVTQQYKLIPNIAKCVVFKMLASELCKLFDQILQEIHSGDLRRLQEIHGLLSCFKPFITFSSAESIEQQRTGCGGHGYHESANFSKLYSTVTAACTYEGENTVLYLQAARYLLKSWQQKLNGKSLDPSVFYIKECSNENKFNWNGSISNIIHALQFVATNKIKIAYDHVENRKASTNCSIEMAMNLTGIELVQAAEAHATAVIINIAQSTIENKLPNTMAQSVKMVLEQLVELYIIDICLKRLNDLLRFINITEMDIEKLRSRLEELLSLLRPNAVSLVDGFDHHDAALCSTLGSYDGNVYERLYIDAQKNPQNQPDVAERLFKTYIKPMRISKL